MSTAARIPVATAPPVMQLSTNRKTCTYAKAKASGGHAPVANAFGCSRDSCLNKTEFCANCYAARIDAWPSVARVMNNNYAALMAYKDRPVGELAEMFGAMLDTSTAAQRLAGVDAPTFRWFWDGDICYGNVARAISLAHETRPNVRGWVYTRAHLWAHRFRLASTGAPPETLAVFLSVDQFNIESAKRAAARWPFLRFAFSADSWAETEQLAQQMNQPRGLKCPELTGRVPLVGDDGRGACTACAHCLPTGAGNVRFSTGKEAPR